MNTERQFIPHASTYLNQERWEDELPVADTKPKLFLPRDDSKLWDFAKQHGLPDPGMRTYPQYRSFLQAEIEKRTNG